MMASVLTSWTLTDPDEKCYQTCKICLEKTRLKCVNLALHKNIILVNEIYTFEIDLCDQFDTK